MTYRSLFVEECPDRASATLPYDILLPFNRPVLCFLDARAWPISALTLARDYDLHTDYVDNCWLLVAVDAAMLRQFLHAGEAVDPNVPNILKRIKDDHWYVINEEEF